jgi:16S rRNA (adenine1518-N6/adenine1519-N6)-dimethyltransferase
MKEEVKLDQHFLLDKKILERIVKLSKPNKKDIILEIGAGKGDLTNILSQKVKKVYAIEKDKELFTKLKKLEKKNVELVLGNALKIEFPELIKIVSNIPYSISEPLIQKLIYYDFELGIFLVPENFSKILIGEKRTKLSLIVETFFEVSLYDKVNPEVFSPEPKVYSRIIVLKPKKPNFKELIFQEFLKQKDKKVKNALREAIIKASAKFNKKITKRKAKQIIKDFKIDKKVQNLNLKELEKISLYLKHLNF